MKEQTFYNEVTNECELYKVFLYKECVNIV